VCLRHDPLDGLAHNRLHHGTRGRAVAASVNTMFF
jgi:hypothetical protein